MESARQLPSGKWQARFTGPDGKRRTAGTHDSKRKAERAAAVALGEFEAHQKKSRETGSTPFSTYAEAYLYTRRPGEPGGLAPTSYYTGKHMDRPGFKELLKLARPGDVILVSSLDRLGRTTLHILETIEKLTAKGVTVKSLKAGEQFEGITGKLIMTIMAAIAEREGENINERAAEGRAARAAKGDSKSRP